MRINDLMNAVKAQFPSLKKLPTRFRAFKIGNAGASFSYFDGTTFTLIEARVTEISRPNLAEELTLCNKTCIDTLHITSWDRDHCNRSELLEILATWKPSRIEYPGYEPDSDCGKACKQAILEYTQELRERRAVSYTPDYIKSLGDAAGYGYRDVVFHPRTIVDKSNDNSTVKLFRKGCFNVLSLGDVEAADIAALIKSSSIACEEVDVLILPHHGADNGFVTSDLLDQIKPKLAVCASNRGNQYGHPAPTIRNLLGSKGVEVATTVRGDVVVWSTNGTSTVEWDDKMSDNAEVHKDGIFEPKKFDKLSKHGDNLRASANPAPYRKGLAMR